MRFSKNQTSFSRAQFGFQKISQEFVAVFTVLLHDKTEVQLDGTAHAARTETERKFPSKCFTVSCHIKLSH
jgi:hypothetical protein